MCARVCVSAWVGQLNPGRFLPVDLSTQPLPNPTAKYQSRSLFLPRVERREDGGNMQQLRSCHESLFSQGSGKPFPPSPTCCFPRTLSLFAYLQENHNPLPLCWYLYWYQPELLVREPGTSLSFCDSFSRRRA